MWVHDDHLAGRNGDALLIAVGIEKKFLGAFQGEKFDPLAGAVFEHHRGAGDGAGHGGGTDGGAASVFRNLKQDRSLFQFDVASAFAETEHRVLT